jgi:RNA polymerase sigma-70 factor (ECF subfamily)
MGIPAEQPQDSRLVAQARAGDPAAFGLLVARYRELLRHVVQAWVHQPAVAEELVQEVFCKA